MSEKSFTEKVRECLNEDDLEMGEISADEIIVTTLQQVREEIEDMDIFNISPDMDDKKIKMIDKENLLSRLK
jgi:hypothetical protein